MSESKFEKKKQENKQNINVLSHKTPQNTDVMPSQRTCIHALMALASQFNRNYCSIIEKIYK